VGPRCPDRVIGLTIASAATGARLARAIGISKATPQKTSRVGRGARPDWLCRLCWRENSRCARPVSPGGSWAEGEMGVGRGEMGGAGRRWDRPSPIQTGRDRHTDEFNDGYIDRMSRTPNHPSLSSSSSRITSSSLIHSLSASPPGLTLLKPTHLSHSLRQPFLSHHHHEVLHCCPCRLRCWLCHCCPGP